MTLTADDRIGPFGLHPLDSLQISAALALNNAHATETSLLDAESMTALIEIAFYARGVAGGAAALLIALDHNAAYDNPNFNWFVRRMHQFVYIDRVIVADSVRGKGMARRLYEDLFAEALRAGHESVVCEVNRHPPNPASDAFHAAMGFVEIGQAAIHGGTKTVRYFKKALKGWTGDRRLEIAARGALAVSSDPLCE